VLHAIGKAAIAAVGLGVGVGMGMAPTAVAGPACPYDMNTKAGQAAAGQQMLNYTNARDTQDLNNLVAACITTNYNSHPTGPLPPPPPPQPVAIPQAPPSACNQQMTQQEEWDRRSWTPQQWLDSVKNCFPAGTNVQLPDNALPKPVAAPQPAAPAPPPPPSPPQAIATARCQQLNDAWSHIDPLKPAADRLAELRHVPGIGEVAAMELIGCSISDLPVDLLNPSRGNQSDTFSGLCNGVDALIPFPTGDPCGNTPAG
jgi:hypothetical protein